MSPRHGAKLRETFPKSGTCHLRIMKYIATRKKVKETAQEQKNRHAEIERLFLEINKLAKEGKMEEALDIRAQADRLRIYW